MMVLWAYGGMTEGEPGRIVHLLKRLEKQGLVARTRPEDNGRRLTLSLTERGTALQERAADVPGAMEGCIDLPAEELLQLKALLERALAKMENTRT